MAVPAAPEGHVLLCPAYRAAAAAEMFWFGEERELNGLGDMCLHLTHPQLSVALWGFSGVRENSQLGQEAKGACTEETLINNQNKT